MQQKGFQPSGSSRRVGGGGPAGALPALSMAPARGWLLKIAACLFVWPLFLALLRGSLREVFAYVVAIALLYVGGRSVRAAYASSTPRRKPGPRPPWAALR